MTDLGLNTWKSSDLEVACNWASLASQLSLSYRQNEPYLIYNWASLAIFVLHVNVFSLLIWLKKAQ